MTSYFAINGQKVFDMNDSLRSLNLFDVPLEFEHARTSGPIRIDVNFGDSYLVAISGFPMDVEVLRDHCAKNGVKEDGFEGEEDPKANVSTVDAEGEVNPEANVSLADAEGGPSGVDVLGVPQQTAPGPSDSDNLNGDSFEIVTIPSPNNLV